MGCSKIYYQRGYNQCLSEITGQVNEEEAYDE